MLAGRTLRELISHTKKTARSFRDSLDEIAQEILQRQRHVPEPLLARVPVRNRGAAPPFGRRSNGHHLRFGQVRFASTYHHNLKPTYVSRLSSANRSVFSKWASPYNAARPMRMLNMVNGNTISRGTFPSTLYANFVQFNSRSYSQYTNFTHECVQNLNQSIRLFLLQTKEEFNDKNSLRRTYRNYGLTRSSEYAEQVFEMAKRNDSFDEIRGAIGVSSYDTTVSRCYVDFKINSLAPSIPSMSFIDDEILQDLSEDVQRYQDMILETLRQINLIKTELGCLPMGTCKDERTGELIFRVHFPNCDMEKVAMLLKDIGVTRGIIREENGPVQGASESSFLMSSLATSFASCADGILSSCSPPLSHEDEELLTDSDVLTDEFFVDMGLQDSSEVIIVDEYNMV